MENLHRYPKKSSSSASRVVDGEAVIVQPMQSSINTLNEVGTRIWELADGSRTLSTIIHEIQNEFDIDPEIISQDTCDFIYKLKEKK